VLARPGIAPAATPEFVGVLALAIEDSVAKTLGLNEEQKNRLLDLIDAAEAEGMELALQLKDAAPADREARLAPFRRVAEAKGLMLLTPAQRAALQKIQAERAAAAPAVVETPAVAELPASPEGATNPAASTPAASGNGSLGQALDHAKPTTPIAEAVPAAPAAVDTSAMPAGVVPGAQPPLPAEAAHDDRAAEELMLDDDFDFDDLPSPLDVNGQGDAPTTTPAAPATTEPSKPVKLRFSFRYTPWKEVLDWFAQQADLSFVTDYYPEGTFNYTDAREYTPAQAIDVLNSVLLTKGYTLIRRERALMLINLEEGIPDNLVETLTPEQLDEKGEFEIASVLFELDRLTPEEAELEIKRMLGPQGRIVTLPKSRQIQVTETGGRLRAIRALIRRVEDPQGSGVSVLRPFDLEHADPDVVLPVLRQLMDIPEGANASSDGSVRIAVDPTRKRLLVNGKPERLSRIEEILKLLDVSGAGASGTGVLNETPQLEVYSITTADSQNVLAIMQTLLAGLPDVRLTVDPQTGNLIALARPSEHKTIVATLQQLQRDVRRFEVFQLRVVDPQLAVLAINKMFNGSSDPKLPANPTSPQVDADPMTRQLIVRGSTAQVEQIRELLTKLGESESGEELATDASRVRMIPLKGRAAQSAIERLEDIWPAVRQNRIRVVTPSAIIPTIRPSGDAEDEGTNNLRSRSAPQPHTAPAAAPSMPAATPTDRDPEPAAELEKSTRHEHRGWNVPVQFVAESAEPADAAEPVEAIIRRVLPPMSIDGNASDEPALAPQRPAVAVPAAPRPAPARPPVAPSADAKEPSPIVVSIGPGGIIIASDDVEALNEFEALLNQMATGAASNVPEMTIFYLKHAKAASVAETLEQIFGGGAAAADSGGGGGGLLGDIAGAALGDRGGGILGTLLGLGEGGSIQPTGSVKITADPRLNALVVQANTTDTEMVEQLLKILDQKGSPEDVLIVPKAKIIAMKNTQAQEVAEIVRQVYSDRVMAASGAGGQGQQARAPSPQEFMQMLRGGGGGRRGGGAAGGGRQPAQEEPQKLTLSVDTRTNSVILAAPEPLFTEVEGLIAQIDKAAVESNQTMRVVQLHKASTDSVQQALSAIVGDMVQFSNTGQRGRQPQQTNRLPQQAQQRRMPGMQQGGMPGGMQGGMPQGGMQGGGMAQPMPQRTTMPGMQPGGRTGGATGGRTGGGRGGR
jgi:type II secretory pathway component GspD/PulD (secretin)